MGSSNPESGLDQVLALLVEVARRHTVGGVLRTIVDGLMSWGESEKLLRAAIWLVDPAGPGGSPVPGAAAGLEARGEEALIGRIMVSGGAAFMSDEDDWDGHGGYPAWAARMGVVELAAVPMTYRDQPVGVLSVHAAASLDAVMEDPRYLLQIVADHGAACIANARASEQLRRVAARLDLENGHLRGDVDRLGEFGDLLGGSAAARKCLEQVDLAAGTAVPVLIRGEGGTGKELVARTIHRRSDRRRGPFVTVSCRSVPPGDDHQGAFADAAGGTLFLKHVDALSPKGQERLQDVLGHGMPDWRLITSTTRNLPEGHDAPFREDLFHRISVMCLDVAPLRNRADDIPILAAAFLRRRCRRLGVASRTLAPDAVDRLMSYGWPGNVREVQAVIEVAAASTVAGEPLDLVLPRGPVGRTRPRTTPVLTDAEFRQRERDNLLAALEEADWQVAGRAGAAARLGIKPTTLSARLRVMGIRKPTRGVRSA